MKQVIDTVRVKAIICRFVKVYQMRTLTANWEEAGEHHLLSTPSLNHCLYAAGVGRSRWIGVFDADEVIVPHRYAYTYPEWLGAYERRKGANAQVAHIAFRNAYFFYELHNRTRYKDFGELNVVKAKYDQMTEMRTSKSLLNSKKIVHTNNSMYVYMYCTVHYCTVIHQIFTVLSCKNER